MSKSTRVHLFNRNRDIIENNRDIYTLANEFAAPRASEEDTKNSCSSCDDATKDTEVPEQVTNESRRKTSEKNR